MFHQRSHYILIISVLALIIVGFVMLFSTCLFSAQANSADVYGEAKRQGMWLGLGLIVCLGATLVDYHLWSKWMAPLFCGTCVLLALCYVPEVGREINGERRWIGIGGIQIQPSELAKIALVVFIASWFDRRPDCVGEFRRGFAYPLLIGGFMIALVLFEVDMGTTAVLSLTTMLLLFVAGTRLRYLVSLFFVGAIGFVGMLSYASGRMERIMAFIEPEAHRLGAGFQQWISLMALGSGGTFGRGVGEGRLKMLYMPFAHTDFIFPMIGEEMGLFGTLIVVLAFISLIVAGFIIGHQAPDRFGSLLAVGLVGFLGFQAFLNIGVTTSVLPNTGLTLPFISYGGSSLVIGLLAIGILLNIYRQGVGARAGQTEWVQRKRMTPRTVAS